MGTDSMREFFNFGVLDNRLVLPIPIEVSRDGRVGGWLARYIVGVEVYDWGEYWRRYREPPVIRDHIRVGGRFIEFDCARLYVRMDGALVVSLDCGSRVIVVRFSEPVWRLLGFETVDEVARAVRHWLAIRNRADELRLRDLDPERAAVLDYLDFMGCPTLPDPYLAVIKVNRRMVIDSQLSTLDWVYELTKHDPGLRVKYWLALQRVEGILPDDKCVKKYDASPLTYVVRIC